ncbi:uncharacterized protein LOC128236447 isoform X2 [Mya arenaria]|nr:uncharacterized protein LOC128236447 isoform X2 [Mya arenaria]
MAKKELDGNENHSIKGETEENQRRALAQRLNIAEEVGPLTLLDVRSYMTAGMGRSTPTFDGPNDSVNFDDAISAPTRINASGSSPSNQDLELPLYEPSTVDSFRTDTTDGHTTGTSFTLDELDRLDSAKKAARENGYDFTDEEWKEAFDQLKRTEGIENGKAVADKLIPIIEAKKKATLSVIIGQ